MKDFWRRFPNLGANWDPTDICRVPSLWNREARLKDADFSVWSWGLSGGFFMRKRSYAIKVWGCARVEAFPSSFCVPAAWQFVCVVGLSLGGPGSREQLACDSQTNMDPHGCEYIDC